MSMWLITASTGNKLEMLDNRLINSDALTYYKSKPIKFDIFVGNPPYINSFVLSNDKEYKAKIKEMYTSAKGAFDICSLFFEACNKISPKARIGFVLPNKLLSSENSRGMREYIVSSEEIHLEQVDDISTVNVFKDASVYPIILITGTQKTQNVAFTYHDKFFRSNVTNKTVPSEYNADQADKFFENFSPHNALEFDSVELGDICELKGAATVGEAYEFRPAVSEKSTKNSLKFVVSGNIFGYGNSWGIQKTQYIKDSYFGPLLNLNNAAIPKKRKDQYLKEKVIVPNMTTSIKAFYDSGNFAPAISTTMVFKKDVSLKVIAAYINSKVANDLYKRMFGSQHLNGGALRVGSPQLKKLPFPKSILENKGTQKIISTLHDQVSKLVEKAITTENAKFMKSLTEDKSLNNFKEITDLLVEIDSIFENAAMEQEKAA